MTLESESRGAEGETSATLRPLSFEIDNAITLDFAESLADDFHCLPLLGDDRRIELRAEYVERQAMGANLRGPSVFFLAQQSTFVVRLAL